MCSRKGRSPIRSPPWSRLGTILQRLEKIRQIRKLIDERGIKYIFFQQVSVSGHVNGKGVVATQWEKVAQEGYQLVYGATADLFVDRHDRYIGFGPEESELAAIADLDTFAQLPWDGASRACSATATTPRPASCSTPTRART